MEKKFFVEGKHEKVSCVMDSPNSAIQAPLIVCMHGFRSSKDSATLSFLSQKLAAAGFHAVRFDFFGHGDSGGEYADVTISKMQQDISNVIDYCSKIPIVDGSKIGLFGSSLGGFNALLFSADHSMKQGRASSSPKAVVSLASSAGIGEKNLMHYNITDAEWKKNGIVSFERHGKTFQLKYGYFKEAKSIRFIEKIRSMKVPALIIHGAQDENTPYSEAELIFEALPGPKRLLRMDGSGHAPNSPIELEQISNATIEWMKQYVK